MLASTRTHLAGARSAEGRTWSPFGSTVLVCGIAAVVAPAAESVAFGWGDPRFWLPDLLTGGTLVAAGAVASMRSAGSRTGRLLSLAGVAWFAGNFTSAEWGPAAWLATQAAYLHRGLIIDAIVSFSTGGVRSRASRAAVTTGYIASLAPLATSDVVTMIVGAALLVGGSAQLGRPWGGSRPSARPAIAAALLLGGAMLIGAAVRISLPAAEGDVAVLLAYQAAVCLAALELAGGVAQRARDHAQLGDLVVELGESRSGSLRDGLAQALGDPTLEVGYWSADRRFVDAAGRALAFPPTRSERVVTVVERAGQPVAAIMHDATVFDDPRLVGAVSTAARLAASNARLHSEVGAQLSELRESRRRLLDAGDEERRRLERRLQDGVERQLKALSRELERTRAHAERGSPVPVAVEEIGVAQEQLARSLGELVELARGLHPRVLAEAGLAGALGQLVASCPVDVELTAADVRLSVAVEVAAYFVCAEALANVAKYAFASHAWIDVRCAGTDLTVRVRDDGVGGADPSRGTGLRGLLDRVEAHGGSLRIDSPPTCGTLLVATIPSRPVEAR